MSTAASWAFVIGWVLLVFGISWLVSVLRTWHEQQQLKEDMERWEPGSMYYSRYRQPKHEEEK